MAIDPKSREMGLLICITLAFSPFNKSLSARQIDCSTLAHRVYKHWAETLACFKVHDHTKYRHASLSPRCTSQSNHN